MLAKHTALTARLLALSALTLSITLVAACETDTGGDSSSSPEAGTNSADASTGSSGGDGDGGDGQDAASDAAGGCASPGDCPAPQTACKTSTCSDSKCGTANAANTTACTDNGGRVCDGSGNCVQCNQPTECSSLLTACKVNTCAGHACGTDSSPKTTSCTDNGGRICDGAGSCVQCNEAANCPAQTTVCKTNTCSGNACGTQNVAKGTACSDNGGVVCDGEGTCVAAHCNDGVKDADETDKDCGGASCGACNTNSACAKDSDCLSKVCDPAAHTCSAPSCVDGVQNGDETDKDCGGATCGKCPDKQHCSSNTDCASGDCFGAAPGTCVSCSDGVKNGKETDTDCGGAACDTQNKLCANDHGCTTAADCQSGFCENGTCKSRPGGTACTDNSQCASGACGVNGTGNCCTAACFGQGSCGPTACDGTGACVFPSGATSCGAISCTNGQLTPPGTCNGAGSCQAGTAFLCPGGFKCATATACKTGCTADADCLSSDSFCSAFQCMPKAGVGAACTSNNSCTSGQCGMFGSGHCCNAGTTCPASVAACGATDCNPSGACAYPGATTAPASLQTPSDCQKVVCNGSGGAMSADDATDIPTSNSACQTSPACCGPSPLTPCFTNGATGTQCSSVSDPAAHVCGATNNGNVAGTCVECNNDVDCRAINPAGTLACDTWTGLCQ